MLRKPIFSTVSIFAILLLALAASGCGAVKTAQEFNQTGNDFMTALKESNYENAYGLFASELQTEVGAIADLQKMIEDNKAQPQEWTFSSWNISTDENKNNTASVEGSVIYQDGRKGAVTLELVKVGEEWKVISFNLTW